MGAATSKWTAVVPVDDESGAQTGRALLVRMPTKDQAKTIVFAAGAVLIVVAAWRVFGGACESCITLRPEELAELFRQKDAKIYGSPGCGYTVKQLALLEQSGVSIPFVNCDGTPEERAQCQAAGVRLFPTASFNGKTAKPGLTPLQQLAKLAKQA